MKALKEQLLAIAPWLENAVVQAALGALAIIVTVFVFTKVAQNLVGRNIKDPALRYRVRRGVAFIGYLLAGLAIASALSDSIGRLTLILGGVGAGIAFALQEVIASVAGWAAITLGGYYSVGHRVQLGGTKGDVIAVGVLRTTLAEVGQWVDGDLYNGRVVRVANSFVFKEPVFNYSGDFPFLWDEIKIPVRFGSDRTLATGIFQSAVDEIVGEFTTASKDDWAKMQRSYALEDARLEPMVTYIFNDNWIEYTVRYVVDFSRRRTTKHLLCEKILDAIEPHADKIQLASATYELVGAPALVVQHQNVPPAAA